MQADAVIQSFVESSRIPLIFVKNENLELEVNSRAKDLIQNLHDAETVSLFDLFDKSVNGLNLLEIIAQVRESDRYFVDVFKLNNVDRRETSLEVLCYPYESDQTRGVCIQLQPKDDQPSTTNGTEHDLLVQEHAAEYADLNSFLSAILDSSTETFIIAVGMNGTILSFNNGACNTFQYAKRDAIARLSAYELFAEKEAPDEHWQEMVDVAFDRGKCERTTNLRRQDGTVFPALVDLTPLRNADNQTLGVLFLGRDMTETMKTQIELGARKQELEFINSVSLEMSETMNLEDVATVALKQIHSEFGGLNSCLFLLEKEEMVYNLISSVPDNSPESVFDVMKPTIEDSLLLETGELLVRGVNRTAFAESDTLPKGALKIMIPLMYKASLIGVAVTISSKPLLRDAELTRFTSALGATVGSSLENAILFDDSITKSQEIKKQNKELDEFAYVVSHDLKEPLAGISFISNLLVDEYYNAFDETGKTYIASLIDFSKRLGSLIDALLDLSRIGRITNPPERVDLHEVIYNVKQNLSHRLNKDEVNFIVPDQLPYVYGDKTRIEQVFFNLIGNAIKFNDKDQPKVEIKCDEESEQYWKFSVEDNGIGIEPEYFDKIFKIFERLQPREEYEGNGAGLTIVKRIIEHHTGQIWLESELDKGTTFYFTLPKFTETL